MNLSQKLERDALYEIGVEPRIAQRDREEVNIENNITDERSTRIMARSSKASAGTFGIGSCAIKIEHAKGKKREVSPSSIRKTEIEFKERGWTWPPKKKSKST